MCFFSFYYLFIYFCISHSTSVHVLFPHFLIFILQIFVRQKNRCSSKAPENPIKVCYYSVWRIRCMLSLKLIQIVKEVTLLGPLDFLNFLHVFHVFCNCLRWLITVLNKEVLMEKWKKVWASSCQVLVFLYKKQIQGDIRCLSLTFLTHTHHSHSIEGEQVHFFLDKRILWAVGRNIVVVSHLQYVDDSNIFYPISKSLFTKLVESDFSLPQLFAFGFKFSKDFIDWDKC